MGLPVPGSRPRGPGWYRAQLTRLLQGSGWQVCPPAEAEGLLRQLLRERPEAGGLPLAILARDSASDAVLILHDAAPPEVRLVQLSWADADRGWQQSMLLPDWADWARALPR
ncbi:hypothetical protein [Phaeovulum sp. W22_SRMD_FR3]|uniref:hypothetical protein n=1 Tax=Phaeovulum sp. W22_SRMD_FR3 TaxID=3240274 RepID=UPI003F96388E